MKAGDWVRYNGGELTKLITKGRKYKVYSTTKISCFLHIGEYKYCFEQKYFTLIKQYDVI